MQMEKIKILHKYLLRTWSCKDNKFTETYIKPFGMLMLTLNLEWFILGTAWIQVTKYLILVRIH